MQNMLQPEDEFKAACGTRDGHVQKTWYLGACWEMQNSRDRIWKDAREVAPCGSTWRVGQRQPRCKGQGGKGGGQEVTPGGLLGGGEQLGQEASKGDEAAGPICQGLQGRAGGHGGGRRGHVEVQPAQQDGLWRLLCQPGQLLSGQQQHDQLWHSPQADPLQ